MKSLKFVKLGNLIKMRTFSMSLNTSLEQVKKTLQKNWKTLKRLNFIWKEGFLFWKSQKTPSQTEVGNAPTITEREIGGRERRIFTINVGEFGIGDAESYIKLYVSKIRYSNDLRNRAVHIPKTDEEKNFFNSNYNLTFVP